VEGTANSDWLQTTIPVIAVESLLQSEYRRFGHNETGATVLRLAAGYSLPASVAPHIDFVGPSIRFPSAKRPSLRLHQRDPARRLLFGPSGDGVDPTFLRKLYNATDAAGASGTKNIQACASFLGQFYSPTDLKTFFSKYAKDHTVTIPTQYGPNTPSKPGVEAELDIQYIMGVGKDIPTQFWSTAGKQPGNPENEPFLVWLYNVSNISDDNMPRTMSVSYGDDEHTVLRDYAARVDVEFQKAGVRGMSIMFSSGDGGVSGSQSQQCTTFIPTWPAGSQWVTSVGGTTDSNPEVCASFSSGGFANYFARPSWQDDAVSGYLNSKPAGLPSSVLYNASGRGIPDVAAQGENFDVIVSGSTEPVDGTSCSSPCFTAIVSLLNEARLAAGKNSLGYLNPLIYKTLGPQGAFNDVTKGDNPGCGTKGFPATKGWDPVTGWGTPKFDVLKALVLALP